MIGICPRNSCMLLPTSYESVTIIDTNFLIIEEYLI